MNTKDTKGTKDTKNIYLKEYFVPFVSFVDFVFRTGPASSGQLDSETCAARRVFAQFD